MRSRGANTLLQARELLGPLPAAHSHRLTVCISPAEKRFVVTGRRLLLQFLCFFFARTYRHSQLDHIKWIVTNASAGNRTRVTSMATMYSATRPLMPLPSICMQIHAVLPFRAATPPRFQMSPALCKHRALARTLKATASRSKRLSYGSSWLSKRLV